MSDLREDADRLLNNFLDQVSGPLLKSNIQIVTDRQLHQDKSDLFGCSVELNQGDKKLSAEKIYVSFSSFPMIKFFGRTWTEFQGELGIAPFVTGIEDRFRHIKA